MAKLKHTRYGWLDGNRAPYIAQGSDPKDKTLRLVRLPESGRCCLPHSTKSLDECPPMTLAECLLLLSNISLGLRTTTLHGQNRYIERWEKTFFRQNAPIALSLSQASTYALSSLANYVHVRRIDKSRGVLEALYEEYLFVCGQLSYSLLEASRRYVNDNDGELDWKIESKKHNLYTQDISKEFATPLSEKMTPVLAMDIVEGAMCSCTLRDRTATNKDKENKQLRSILSIYDGIALDMDKMYQDSVLVSDELITYFVQLSQSAGDNFWVVLENDDCVSSSAKWAKNHPSRRFKELS